MRRNEGMRVVMANECEKENKNAASWSADYEVVVLFQRGVAMTSGLLTDVYLRREDVLHSYEFISYPGARRRMGTTMANDMY